MSEAQFKSILLDYMVERKGIIEAKSDLLRLYAMPQTVRQAQILSDYIEEMLTSVKFDGLPLDLAVTGLSEMASAGFAV